MEAIIGFAIGYLVGVREGPNGLGRMRAQRVPVPGSTAQRAE
jgi:hypothetical protein